LLVRPVALYRVLVSLAPKGGSHWTGSSRRAAGRPPAPRPLRADTAAGAAGAVPPELEVAGAATASTYTSPGPFGFQSMFRLPVSASAPNPPRPAAPVESAGPVPSRSVR